MIKIRKRFEKKMLGALNGFFKNVLRNHQIFKMSFKARVRFQLKKSFRLKKLLEEISAKKLLIMNASMR